MPKYRLHVTWAMAGWTVIEAEDEEAACEAVEDLGLDALNADDVPGTFSIDDIYEVDGEEEQRRDEKRGLYPQYEDPAN